MFEKLFKVGVIGLTIMTVAMFGIKTVQAEDEEARKALAAESEAYCAETGKQGNPSPEEIMAKVNDAAALVQKEGEASFPKFKGKGSPFIFKGTYIWIHDEGCVMKMHPIKNAMEGKEYIGLKDANGKRIFVEMNDVAFAQGKGAGWVEYVWPKPGDPDKKSVPKISYVKSVKTPDGKNFVVGCGIYDMPPELAKKLIESN